LAGWLPPPKPALPFAAPSPGPLAATSGAAFGAFGAAPGAPLPGVGRPGLTWFRIRLRLLRGLPPSEAFAKVYQGLVESITKSYEVSPKQRTSSMFETSLSVFQSSSIDDLCFRSLPGHLRLAVSAIPPLTNVAKIICQNRDQTIHRLSVQYDRALKVCTWIN
jgi:hypothetical protein